MATKFLAPTCFLSKNKLVCKKKPSKRNSDAALQQLCGKAELLASSIEDQFNLRDKKKKTTTTTALGSWGWERLEALRRDKEVFISTPGYLAATMDQRCPSLKADTACSMLALTLADWLVRQHRNPPTTAQSSGKGSAVLMPSPPTLDSLLLKGSRRWRQMLELPEVQALCRADGLQEIDTAFQHGSYFDRMSLAPDEGSSFTAFFRPLDGELGDVEVDESVGFDSIWASLVAAASQKQGSSTYIVGWNSHYFVLHIPQSAAAKAGALYVLDTLGSRLSASCHKAYVLKLDATTRLSYANDNKLEEGLQSCDACKFFLRDFLAGFSIKKACENYKEGLISRERLLEVLQIDFRAVKLRES